MPAYHSHLSAFLAGSHFFSSLFFPPSCVLQATMDDKEECTNVAELAAALRKDLSVILTTVDDMLTKLAALEARARNESNSSGETLVGLSNWWHEQEPSEHSKSSLTNLDSLRSCEVVSVECSPDDVGSVNITDSSECLSPPSECDSLLFSRIAAHDDINNLDDDYDSCCGGEQEHWAELVSEKNQETPIFSPARECVAEDPGDHHECVSVSCVTSAETTAVAQEPVTTSSSISDSSFKRRFLWLVNKLFPNQQKFDPDDPFILQTLYDMGFTDEKQNSKVLHECNGVIPRVLDSLLESSNDS